MSGDPEQEYFSDGITEDITTALSHFSDLFVIARNSSFTYKGKAVDTRLIAAELGVRYLLEGSVRRAGDRIRINGQLINAETGNHIWAERFDGDLEDIFELQDEITRKIVGSIAPQIELAEVERGRGLQPASLSSYELSLKAKSEAFDAFRLGDANALQNAIDIANDALKQDPRNTQALWLLGVTQMDQYLYQWGDDPAGALERAMQAAEKLIQVDSSNAAGYVLRGTLLIHRREFDLAISDFERSLSLNANASLHLFFAAWGESLAGLTKLAKEHAELGIRLSPREMDLWMGVAYLALLQASFAEEDFTDAIKWGRLSIQMHAKAPIRRALMVACCAYTGNLEEAATHADELKIFSPDFIPTILRGDLLLYRDSTHNKLLIEGLRKAGLHE
jgi:TolB-like protein